MCNCSLKDSHRCHKCLFEIQVRLLRRLRNAATTCHVVNAIEFAASEHSFHEYTITHVAFYESETRSSFEVRQILSLLVGWIQRVKVIDNYDMMSST
jgi:hypothetical protein